MASRPPEPKVAGSKPASRASKKSNKSTRKPARKTGAGRGRTGRVSRTGASKRAGSMLAYCEQCQNTRSGAALRVRAGVYGARCETCGGFLASAVVRR